MKYGYVYGKDICDEYPNIRIGIERITPSIAKKMLVANINNRDKKRESIKRGIDSGQWRLNGETIVFSDDGVLLDGQNRLTACVESGIAIDTIVVRGVKQDAQLTMDQGVRRTLADYLKMNGVKNSADVATIGRGIFISDMSGLESVAYSNGIRKQYTVTDMFVFCMDNNESRIQPILKSTCRVARKYNGVNKQLVGALFDTFRCIDEDDMNAFAEQILGVRTRCGAVSMLDNALVKNAQDKNGKLNHRTIAAYFIKAWNAFMTGDDLVKLQFRAGGARPESFPVPVTSHG